MEPRRQGLERAGERPKRRDGKKLGKERVTGALRMYGKVRVQVVVELPASFRWGIRLPFDCLERKGLTVLQEVIIGPAQEPFRVSSKTFFSNWEGNLCPFKIL